MTPATNIPDAALQGSAATLLYAVSSPADVLGAVQKRIGKAATPVDARGQVDAPKLRAEIEQRARAGGPVLVLLGAVVHPTVRTVLSTLLESEGAPLFKLVALTSARSVEPELRALFPMQIAAERTN